MLYKHITASGAVNAYSGKIKKAYLQVNAALTGTITISDETGITGSPVVALITNPAVGLSFEYWGLTSGITVNPSATCDITISADLSFSGAS